MPGIQIAWVGPGNRPQCFICKLKMFYIQNRLAYSKFIFVYRAPGWPGIEKLLSVEVLRFVLAIPVWKSTKIKKLNNSLNIFDFVPGKTEYRNVLCAIWHWLDLNKILTFSQYSLIQQVFSICQVLLSHSKQKLLEYRVCPDL